MTEPNVGVAANVMTVLEGESVVAYLPGDFAVRVYQGLWSSTQVIQKRLSKEQWLEYHQYLVCLKCGRPCAGTCVMKG